MGIKRGTLEVGSIFRGSVVISKVYRGSTVIYELADGTFLELIEDITVAGSAVTSVQFSGFTATKEDTLVLVSDINNTTGVGSHIYMYVNNNLTATNYYDQFLQVNGTAVNGVRENNARLTYVEASSKMLSNAYIKLTNDGYFTVQSQNTRVYTGSGLFMFDEVISSTFTMTDITQLDVRASVASAIGIGSRFQLYKIVGV